MKWDPEIPSNKFPLLPPELEHVETRSILKACIKVRAAIAELKCRIDNLVERGVAKRQTASIYLKQLVSIGILKEMEVGREKLYINTRLLRELSQ